MSFEVQKRLSVVAGLGAVTALVWLWPTLLLFGAILLVLAIVYQALLLYLAYRFDPKDPERRDPTPPTGPGSEPDKHEERAPS